MKKNNAFTALLIASIFPVGLAVNAPAFAANGAIVPEIDSMPQPFHSQSAKNYSKVIGWVDGETPVAPAGFTVTMFADELEHPRWIYAAENGDVFVVESNMVLNCLKRFIVRMSRELRTQHYGVSANRITMFRDENNDGVYEKRFKFAEHLNQPFGILILNDHFYVGNTDGLVSFDYTPGDTVVRGKGKTILSLPANKPNTHWTRNIISNKTGDKIYIGVGSATNIAEKGLDKEIGRAAILEVNPDGSGERIYASGLRNPVGMDWAPETAVLWTAVNERDGLGDELVPDYLTSVRDGGFYGWPFVYFGQHPDPRMKKYPRPDFVKSAIVPDYKLGPHTASLGLVFYRSSAFPPKYRNGAFVTQHGSWNRAVLSGYKVVYIPFLDGQPSGEMEDFLTGFIVEGSTDSEVRGRPVGLAVLADGSMLVSDDAGNIIWKISVGK